MIDCEGFLFAAPTLFVLWISRDSNSGAVLFPKGSYNADETNLTRVKVEPTTEPLNIKREMPTAWL
jgi:hypothetical protein